MNEEIDLFHLLSNIKSTVRKYKIVFLLIFILSIIGSYVLYTKASDQYRSQIVFTTPKESELNNSLVNQIVSPLLEKLNFNQIELNNDVDVENIFSFESSYSINDNLVKIEYSYIEDFNKEILDKFISDYINNNRYVSTFVESKTGTLDDVFKSLDTKIEYLSNSLDSNSKENIKLTQEEILSLSVIEELKYKLYEFKVENSMSQGVHLLTSSEESKILEKKSLFKYLAAGIVAAISIIMFTLLFIEIFRK